MSARQPIKVADNQVYIENTDRRIWPLVESLCHFITDEVTLFTVVELQQLRDKRIPLLDSLVVFMSKDNATRQANEVENGLRWSVR